MILITGATGAIGTELCQLLAQQNIPARAMCRKETQVDTFRKMGLEAVLGDFAQPESLRQAMLGCQRLFLLSPPAPTQAEWEKLAIDLAVEAGIQHIVKVSAADANLSTKVHWARAHAQIDHYLRSKPLNWTILRPTGFMQNFVESARPISKGMLPHIMGNGQVSYIDLRDIALVAKHVLTEDIHHGAIYYLTGPESLTANDVADQLSTAVDHTVKAAPISVEQMHQTLTIAGLTEWLIEALLAQYEVIANGHNIDTTEEIKRLTGQNPRTFAQFAQAYNERLIAIN